MSISESCVHQSFPEKHVVNQDLIVKLSNLPSFREIEPDHQRELLNHSKLEIFLDGPRSYRGNLNCFHTIHPQNQEVSHVYFVIDGRVREVNYDLKGKASVVSLINDNGWFGIKDAIEGYSNSSAIAEAMIRTEVLEIPSQIFREVYQKSDVLKEIYLEELLKENEHLLFMQEVLPRTVKSNLKLMKFLRRAIFKGYATKNKDNPDLRYLSWPQFEIADFIGVARETVAREMKILLEKGLVNRLGICPGMFGCYINNVRISELP